MGFSKVTTPDFAFPKTVAKDAYADLKKADAQHDAHAALNALIRISVAENLIDGDSLQASIRLVEETAAKYTEDKLYGLFPALLAKLYATYYGKKSWQFDQRETPIEPYPADISEWNGRQFRMKITELLRESLSDRCTADLNTLKVEDYTDLITTGDLTTTYYPTLLDFCFSNAEETVDFDTNFHKEILLQAYQKSIPESAPYILWKWKALTSEEYEYNKIFEIAKDLADNRYSGFIFLQLSDRISSVDVKRSKEYIHLAIDFIARYSDSSFKASIENSIKRLMTASATVSLTNLCSPGNVLDVNVTSLNAEKIDLKVYYNGLEPLNLRSGTMYDALIAKAAEKTVPVRFSGKLPFKSDTTIALTLDKPGYYYVIPTIDNKKIGAYSVNEVRCFPVLPVAVSTDNLGDIIAVEPYSGSPLKNVGIALTNRYTRIGKETIIDGGTTDNDGVANVFDKMKPDNAYCVTAKTGGKRYKFDNVTIYRNGKRERDVKYNAQVLTDRLLYHPGDKAEVLVVLSVASPREDNGWQLTLSEKIEISIKLMDANYQPVDTAEVTTDDWGRATASFKIPTEGLSGNFEIRIEDIKTGKFIGNHSIMVSDYRMPDFEIKIDETACDEPSKGFVTIKGTAISYSGMPMADADIILNLSESSWEWWRWSGNQEKIYTAETSANAQGQFTFIVPDTVLTDREQLYVAAIEGVSVTGSTAQANTAFTLAKKYNITVNIPDRNVDGEKPLHPDVKVFAPDGSTVDIPLEWALVSGNDIIYQPFNGEIDLSKVKPASYTLLIRSADPELADPESTRITVYNRSTGIVPDDNVLWVPLTSYLAGADGEVDVEYANAYDDTYIYFYQTIDNKTERPVIVKARKGYNSFKVTMKPNATTSRLNMFTVRKGIVCNAQISIKRENKKGLKITGESFRDNLIPGTKETWKIKITDVEGRGSQSAVVLDMYNKALDAIMSQTQNLRFPIYDYQTWLNVNHPNVYTLSRDYNEKITYKSNNVYIQTPEFNFYDGLGRNSHIIYSTSSNMMIRGRSYGEVATVEEEDGVLYEMAAPAPAMAGGTMNASKKRAMADMEAPLEEAADATDDIGVNEGKAQNGAVTFDYRDANVPIAIWAPTLTSDKDGSISYTFTVPNANTTWRLQAVAWSRDMEVGSMMRDFVASKPVMVQPNLPRFLRNGDETTVVASVMNNTEDEQKVTTTVEIFNPLTNDLLKTKTFTQTISPKGYDKVNVKIYAEEDINAIGYRIRSTNGDFSDGEQSVIRVLPSEQSLIETTPFYLNPGEKEYTTTLPSDEGARLSLTFCENPAWTIVSALPGLRTQIREYANSAAAAIYSSAISQGIIKENPKIGEVLKAWLDNPGDSALVSMLEKNEDLKIAVLSATPWVSSAQTQNDRMANLAMIFNDNENAKTISAAMKILRDLQNPDGGWAWAKWCDNSSVWTTSNVLAMLGDLRRIDWMPADKELSDMLTRAVNYYDNKVEKTDLMYCLVRPLFGSQVSANGKKVINATLAEIKKNWKSYSDPAYKAMAAKALYLNGDKTLATELMRSISEFGVYTKSQGLKFPNVNALYNYAIILDAYAMITPDSKDVDGLRQQLIVRKQGTDWGDAVVTMEVVKAILTSGSTWTVVADGANVTAGGKEIMPKGAVERATGSFTADLSDYAGKELTVTTSGTGPAYGAVFSQFNLRMDKVEARGCDDLDIEKQLFVRRGMEWETADSLKVGDRVKVQLTIHCKRNLQYVEIIDKRPATFEPVKQLPGWEWSEGVGFYRENSDSQTDLHVVYMSPGTYLLTYEMNVNLAGSFTSGVASIQSQYAPEISAHSGGEILKVISDSE